MRTKRWGVARILQGLALLALGGCTAASRPPSPHDAVDEGALFEVIDRDQSGTVTQEEFVRTRTARRRAASSRGWTPIVTARSAATNSGASGSSSSAGETEQPVRIEVALQNLVDDVHPGGAAERAGMEAGAADAPDLLHRPL